MLHIPIEEFNIPLNQDPHVLKSWTWFISLLTPEDWLIRKKSIEEKITVEERMGEPFSESLDKGTLLVVNDDQIGWYLYLVDMFLNEPHKYEYFQGARVIPIFKRLGMDIEILLSIEGIKSKVRSLLKTRKSEADAMLFEILTALVWTRNGWHVSFLKESKNGKMPDLFVKKADEEFYIECKRQKKTSDYTYRETRKRQLLISYLNRQLLANNILLDIIFHVELESLADTYLRDLLIKKLDKITEPCKISVEGVVDIEVSLIDINYINEHLKKHWVKHHSPQMNQLIGKKSPDNMSFTCGLHASFIRVGEGEINNLYINEISRAYGVFWRCDAEEAVLAKARDIKKQLFAALEQFQPNKNAIVHIGMETFDGPEIEMKRHIKITDTLNNIHLSERSLKWVYCHFFQSYSTTNETWVFDETVKTISSNPPEGFPPLHSNFLVVPDEDILDDMTHWDRGLPL
jgi:hypothetical protein